MATKKQIAEQAMRILSGGHLKPDRTIDIREVMLHLDQLRNKAIELLVLNNIKQGVYEIPADLLSRYSVTVIVTPVGSYGYGDPNRKSMELPVKPINLPNDIGLYEMNSDDYALQFIKLPGTGKLYHGKEYLLPSSSVILYTRAGKNIQLLDTYSSMSVSDTVEVLMVVDSIDIAEDDFYPLTPELEADLLTRLVEVFGVMKEAPHDEVENNQKNQ